jgi:hypothetical protein
MDWFDNLDFDEIRRLRKQNPSQEAQNFLQGHDRRAFLREQTNINPLSVLAAPAVPLEQLFKAITGEGRSKPSLDAALISLRGYKQGLQDKITPLWDK